MKPRFLILLAAAIGLAVYFATAKNKATPKDEDELTFIGETGASAESIAEGKIPLSSRKLPGKKPKEEPVFDVRVEVDPSGKKNRLYFSISEKHGYYVETFTIRAWYVRPGVTGPENSPLPLESYKDIYLRANETLRTCLEVVPAELGHVNGNIGTSANWEAEIALYGRAREKNPDPLPPARNELNLCDK